MNTSKKATILVVDDENGVRQSFNMVLKDIYQVLLSASGREAWEILEKKKIDIVLLDIMLPDANGMDILQKIKEMDPNTEVIMVTAVKEIQTAVKAIKLGAYEYIIKPFIVDDVLTIINRALEKKNLIEQVIYLKDELNRYGYFEKIVGSDKKMLGIFDLIQSICDSDGAVLIQGESGTGKELVARAVHNQSSRKNHPFIVINCAAIPMTLMESELFGHIKGAFTGASSTIMGKLELADKGTAFLDDIDCLDVNMQAKLLRVIQEKEFEKLGSNKVIKTDVRFVAASNKDLPDLIEKGLFRGDLFYRLNVFPIRIPPLRERRGDVELLLQHFLDLHSRRRGRPGRSFSREAINALTEYDWPGNVRELQNLVERVATITKDSVIGLKDLATLSIGRKHIKDMPLKEAVNAFEKQYITEVLESVDYSRKRASEILGVHRNTLLSRMTELGIKE
ncbi:MAG: sigma-54-dependent Fis family transcriptional regulator [Desulfobacteraceae bacterium]|nr:MAG: sigma-54-dependent Fis family transcriptional regulator [Desulfobacteraceae bacterium]